MDREHNMVIVEVTGLRETVEEPEPSCSWLKWHVSCHLQCGNGHELAGCIRQSGGNMPR